MKTATVCAITSPKFNTLRQMFQFCGSLRQSTSPLQIVEVNYWLNAPVGH